jgi:hypothetical protein
VGCSPAASTENGDESSGTDGGAVVGPPIEGSDGCSDAPLVDDGRWRVDLRGYSTGGTVACGALAGDGFFRYRVKARSDVTVRVRGERFQPIVAVVAGGCPGGSLLACSVEDGRADPEDPNVMIVELPDLRAGSELSFMVGIGAEVLEGLGEGELETEVIVSSSPVWVAGQGCGALGRCASGARCDGASNTCVEVMGASCGWPVVLPVVTNGSSLLDVPSGLTRAHAAKCDGAGEPPEAGGGCVVVRLDLAPELAQLPATARLAISASLSGEPVRVLDLRSPTCELTDRVACAATDAGGSLAIELDDLARRAAAGERPILVLELPPPPAAGEGTGENPPPEPLTVEYAVIDG